MDDQAPWWTLPPETGGDPAKRPAARAADPAAGPDAGSAAHPVEEDPDDPWVVDPEPPVHDGPEPAPAGSTARQQDFWSWASAADRADRAAPEPGSREPATELIGSAEPAAERLVPVTDLPPSYRFGAPAEVDAQGRQAPRPTVRRTAAPGALGPATTAPLPVIGADLTAPPRPHPEQAADRPAVSGAHLIGGAQPGPGVLSPAGPQGLPESLTGGRPHRPRMLARVGRPHIGAPHFGGDRLDPRRTIALLALGAAVIVVAVVLLLIGGGKDKAPAPPPAATTAAKAAGALKGTPPKGLRPVTPADAAAALRRTGTAGGQVLQAFGWSDRNGRNLVAEIVEPGSPGRTLRVVHLTRLDAGKGKVSRVMRDPDLPGCSGGAAGFTPGSLLVRDLNADDVAEIAVGWTGRCGSASTASTVKLALLSDGKKFIIRGEGVVGHPGSGSSAPDPKASSWPKGFLPSLRSLFRELYY